MEGLSGTSEEKRVARPFWRAIADYAELLIITLFIMLLLFTYVFRVVTVNGDSMRETLLPGDKVIIFVPGKPKQGDIAVIQADKAYTLDDMGELKVSEGVEKSIIKRVIATGGQTVDIDFGKGAVYVDGERYYEPYLKLGLTHLDEGAFTDKYPVTVPEGYVFVMGDNRSVSLDSRSSKVGFVPEESIIGRMLLKLWNSGEELTE